jgi:uncharacterized short protein YbdD (DUF466 family)
MRLLGRIDAHYLVGTDNYLTLQRENHPDDLKTNE